MIDNAALTSILQDADDISLVVELYSADTTPSTDGFDPGDALGCFAAVAGITFRGRNYSPIVERFGSIKRTISKEINSTSVTFNNLDRAVAQFEFQYGFEGLIMVIRLLSRGESVLLTDTQILFVGRCEKPTSGSKENLQVSAKFVVGSLDVRIPRRKFGPDDNEGRTSDNPEFEGFIFMPQEGVLSYNRIEKRGGFLGWWNKKEVRVTEQYSSYTNYNANKSLPEAFGKIQMLGTLMAAADVGIAIRMRVAFCEGPIEGIENARSTDTSLPLSPTSYAEVLGEVGTANGPDDPLWIAPGLYSRTAHIRCQADNSALDSNDPAPDVAAVILGRKVYVPDSGGAWVTYQWSDNPAAVVRFLLTDSNYYRLDGNWIEDAYFTTAYDDCAELIFNTSVDDFIFTEEG